MIGSRHAWLVAVIMLVLLILTVGRVEGYTAACKNSLLEWDDDNNMYGTGDGPPVDPKECKDDMVGRGGVCYKVENGRWENTDSKDCKSWTRVVNWQSKAVQGKAVKRSWAKVKGYQRRMHKNFKGDEIPPLGEPKDPKNMMKSSMCAAACDIFPGEKCKGFVIERKKNGKCWILDAARVGKELVNGDNLVAFTKGGTSASSGDGSGTPPAAGGTKGSGKIDKVRKGGRFLMKVKYAKTSGAIGSKDTWGYIKHDANETECIKTDDDKQIKVNKNGEAHSPWDTWVFQKQKTGWAIKNEKHNSLCGKDTKGQDAGYSNLSVGNSQGCDTQGNKVMFSNWGDWVLEPQGDGYKFRLSNCGKDGKGAYLYVNENFSNMTSKANGTTIYLEKLS